MAQDWQSRSRDSGAAAFRQETGPAIPAPPLASLEFVHSLHRRAGGTELRMNNQLLIDAIVKLKRPSSSHSLRRREVRLRRWRTSRVRCSPISRASCTARA